MRRVTKTMMNCDGETSGLYLYLLTLSQYVCYNIISVCVITLSQYVL